MSVATVLDEQRDIDLDLFAAGGGWDVAAVTLGMSPVGVEWDRAACLTAAAAGHIRIQADVAAFVTAPLKGRLRGLIGSPPCTLLSAAGHGTGRLVLDDLCQGVHDMLAGNDTREALRAQIVPVTMEQKKASNLKRPAAKRWSDEKVKAAAEADAYTAALIVEPARFIYDLNPEWIALEQVPEALPVWRAYRIALHRLGYSAWTGILNAADYGVPQTRQRAFLIASRVRRVGPPPPTHTKGGSDADLFGEQLDSWVSMATALGWGATARPVPTVTAGGGQTGGPEPIARGGRAAIEAERDSGGALASASFRLARGAGMNSRYGMRPDTPATEPAPVVTSKARTATWVQP